MATINCWIELPRNYFCYLELTGANETHKVVYVVGKVPRLDDDFIDFVKHIYLMDETDKTLVLNLLILIIHYQKLCLPGA